jgi:hypothetical protein
VDGAMISDEEIAQIAIVVLGEAQERLCLLENNATVHDAWAAIRQLRKNELDYLKDLVRDRFPELGWRD